MHQTNIWPAVTLQRISPEATQLASLNNLMYSLLTRFSEQTLPVAFSVQPDPNLLTSQLEQPPNSSLGYTISQPSGCPELPNAKRDRKGPCPIPAICEPNSPAV